MYDGSNLIFTAEVKDKIFTAEDVEHAISKVVAAQKDTLIFIKGPRAELSGNTEEEVQSKWGEKGFSVIFVDSISYFTSALSFLDEPDVLDFVGWLNKHADSAKIKDETFEHLKDCMANQGW